MSKTPNDSKEITVSLDLIKKIWSISSKIISIAFAVFIAFELLSINSVLNDIAGMQYVGFGLDGGTTTSADTSQTTESNTVDYSVLEGTEYLAQQELPSYATVDNLFNVESGDYAIMFRSASCGYCHDAELVIQQWLDAGNTADHLYFVDTDDNTSFWATSEDMPEITNPTVDNFYILGTPSLLVKENGVFRLELGAGGLNTILANLPE